MSICISVGICLVLLFGNVYIADLVMNDIYMLVIKHVVLLLGHGCGAGYIFILSAGFIIVDKRLC